MEEKHGCQCYYPDNWFMEDNDAKYYNECYKNYNGNNSHHKNSSNYDCDERENKRKCYYCDKDEQRHEHYETHNCCKCHKCVNEEKRNCCDDDGKHSNQRKKRCGFCLFNIFRC